MLECSNIAKDVASRTKVYFAVETLEYLHKGGRINTAAAFLGTALNLKPILELKDGVIIPVERVRTSRKAHQRLLELAEQTVGPHGKIEFLGLVSADAREAVEELREEAHKRFQIEEELVTDLSAVLDAMWQRHDWPVFPRLKSFLDTIGISLNEKGFPMIFRKNGVKSPANFCCPANLLTLRAGQLSRATNSLHNPNTGRAFSEFVGEAPSRCV